MNNFFKNLIERHTQPVGKIKPRLSGVFKPDRNPSLNFGDPEASQFVIPEKEENSDPVQSTEGFINKVDKIKRNAVSQKNTISSYETSEKPQSNKTGNQSLSINKIRDVQGIEKSKSIEKPVPKMKNEIKKNSEKMASDSQPEKQKSDFNVFQIKPEIKPEFGETLSNRNDTGKSKLSGDDKTQKSIQPEKQFTPSEKKVVPNKNERNGTMGLKLPNRFNQWMNEPVKQSQPKGNEISSPQTIKVNIGRIEVKAIMEQNGTPVSRKPAFKPKLSLNDYLNQRNGGKR